MDKKLKQIIDDQIASINYGSTKNINGNNNHLNGKSFLGDISKEKINYEKPTSI